MKNFSFALPMNISYMWNMGSMLGLIFTNQIITGFLVSMHFLNSTDYAFLSYMMITRNIKMGFFIKYFHANGASLMFFFMYIHIYRSFLNKSPKNIFMWISGIIIIFILMMTAFVGYVLPWGQMSFWAATVITNLISSIPYIGNMITKWLWGGFSVSNPTLNRFFSIHFIMPFVLLMLVLIHILILHIKGSNNPLGMNSNMEKIPFKEYFMSKDLITIIFMFWFLMMLSMIKPNLFLDPENFLMANPMVTPNHIKPEWYFLFAYAILRSIPNKLGGVLALVTSILILLMKINSKISKFNMIFKIKNNMIFMSFVLLSFLGGMPIEEPYYFLSKLFSLVYFFLFI